MTRTRLGLIGCVFLSGAAFGAQVEFAAASVAKRVGDKVTITFTVSKATDAGSPPAWPATTTRSPWTSPSRGSTKYLSVSAV